MKRILIILAMIAISGCVEAQEPTNDWKAQFDDCELQRIPNTYRQWLVRKNDGTILLIETDHDGYADPYKVVSRVVIFEPRK